MPTSQVSPALISVIVPTTLRSALTRAISSINNQNYPRDAIEIVICVDRHITAAQVNELRTKLSLLPQDKIVSTSGNEGGGAARNLGIISAAGEWVAFLDDDDEFRPQKLSEQFKAALSEAEPLRTIVSCRVAQKLVNEPSTEVCIPRDLIQPHQRPEDYLFRHRLASLRRASLYTSTIFLSRDLAESVPWDSSLARHQDWDWLLKLSVLNGVKFVQLPAPLSVIWVGSEGSISARSDWRTSLDWAKKSSGTWNRQTLTDFLAAQTMRYALQARSFTGVRRTLVAIIGNGRLPSLSCLAIASSGLLNRKAIEIALRKGKLISAPKRPEAEREH